MNRDILKSILDEVRSGKMDPARALEKIRYMPLELELMEYATVDHGRGLRLGLGEVIYGENKTTKQILGIAGKLSRSKDPILITRLSEEKIKALRRKFPKGKANVVSRTFTVNPLAPVKAGRSEPYVCIVTAGTSDAPVAEEAADVCCAMGVAFVRVTDIGVSGIHRVMKNVDVMENAAALVVIAGMEGALPSVIGGLISKPIFAVPTDVGYGANFGGVTALLGMLSSCAPGVAVSNINAGFSAAYSACRVVNGLKTAIADMRRGR